MNPTILIISLFWTAYGILGVLGLQVAIPKKFRGQPWTKAYIRKQGLSWVMLGVPFLVIALLWSTAEFWAALPVMVACAVPSLLYSRMIDKEYTKMLQNTPK